MWILAIYLLLEIANSFVDGASYEIITLFQLTVLNLLAFNYASKTKEKTVLLSLFIYNIYVAITALFTIEASVITIISELFLLVSFVCLQINKKYNYSNDIFYKEYVSLLFYKPKSFKQYLLSLFGYPVSSFGMYINDKFYHLSWKSKTVVATEDFINTDDYIIVRTKTRCDKVSFLIPELLKQKARQPKTLYLRLNCLRCFKEILGLLEDKWHYKGEVLPSIYLRKRL